MAVQRASRLTAIKQVWCVAIAGGVLAFAWGTAGCASVAREPAQAPRAPESPAEPAPAATNQPPPAEGYAWDDLARLAAANCGEAKALLLEAGVERHQAAVDAGWRNPQLRVGRRWGDEDEVTPGRPLGGGREWSDKDYDCDELGLRVYTSNPFVNRWLRRRGEATARAREAASHVEAYAVFCEVRSLCLEAEMLREEIALLENMVGLRDALCKVRNEQAEVGVVSPLELVRAETRLAAVRSEIREKRTDRQRLIRRVAVLTGLPAGQLKLKTRQPGAPIAAESLDPATLTDLAFMRRPDLARAEREKEAAENGLKASQAGRIPWFEYVEGTVEDEKAHVDNYEQDVPGYERTTRDQTEWQIRVAVTVPVFNWLGDEVRLSRAQLAAAEARVTGLYDQVRAEVGGVLEDYRDADGERARLVGECDRLCDTMTSRIDALEKDPAVKHDEVLEAREELVVYRRVCLKAERECLRLAQDLETVCGGTLGAAQLNSEQGPASGTAGGAPDGRE